MEIAQQKDFCYAEDDLLPVSALAQLVYCERRCALIFLEGAWAENRFTAEGRLLHERLERGGVASKAGIRTVYELDIRSTKLGLVGKVDAVEFNSSGSIIEGRAAGEPAPGNQSLDDLLAEIRTEVGASRPGAGVTTLENWVPFPVERKRGQLKLQQCYEVQLCAQGLCLEEMLGVPVPAGAIYYGGSRRRKRVFFDTALRKVTVEAALRLHSLVASGVTPRAEYSKRCGACSLLALCMPRSTSRWKSVHQYLAKSLEYSCEID